MSKKLSILSHTYSYYCDHMQSLLGKGAFHARLVYEEWFRAGKVEGKDPAFKNAHNLFSDTHDNLEIESVLIPMQAGGTLCVSSQVGCRMGCTFCETGRMGLLRNLTVSEIVGQVFIARHILGFDFRNIVFMGMGEPFDNYESVMQSVRILNDPKGLSFGRRHVTVSTSGCIDGIEKLMLEGDHAPNLAVSINAPQDALRNKIMPINRKHNMAELHEVMKRYNSSTGREILIAYVLLKAQNDTLEHANQLADYLQGLNVKVNLIPYNPQSKDRFARPEDSVLESFTKQLRARGYYTLLRVTKGKDIMAACGQLGNVNLRRQLRDTSV